jgi:phosphatidylinositol alpha-1,6-mannosyltransferase
MHKLLLITSDFPPRLGGIATYYANLVKNIPELEVLTNMVGAKSQRVHEISWHWPGWPSWLPLLWLIPLWQWRLKCKLVAAGEILPIGTALWLMSLALGTRYIVFSHGLDVQLTQITGWKKWLARQIMTRAAGLIANSEFTKGLLVKAGALPSKITVVYPAVIKHQASAAIIQQLKQQYGLAGKFIILTVARLVARKGVAQVMAALRQAQADLPEFVYVVVGDGPYKQALQTLAQVLGINIIFTGTVSEEVKAAWYQLCDIFVLTPQVDVIDVEGFGIVYLEAQAHGKPVVAAAVGGVPEAVGMGGILVEDVGKLKQVLIGLIKDKGARQILAARGLAHVAEFTPKHQAEQFLSAVNKLNV